MKQIKADRMLAYLYGKAILILIYTRIHAYFNYFIREQSGIEISLHKAFKQLKRKNNKIRIACFETHKWKGLIPTIWQNFSRFAKKEKKKNANNLEDVFALFETAKIP